MRLSWQPLWVEWENNVSCSHVILQVKIGLTENIMFKRKKGRSTQRNCQFSYILFFKSNHLCSPYPPFLKQCVSFPLPKAKLGWEKMETNLSFLNLSQFCLHVYAWEMAVPLSKETCSVSWSQPGHILCPLVWVRATENDMKGEGVDKLLNVYV